jgi:hypothetical protein
MKIVTMIARYLLGLMFLVFGSNVFLNLIPVGPMPAGLAGQFMTALVAAHYFYGNYILDSREGIKYY